MTDKVTNIGGARKAPTSNLIGAYPTFTEDDFATARQTAEFFVGEAFNAIQDAATTEGFDLDAKVRVSMEITVEWDQ